MIKLTFTLQAILLLLTFALVPSTSAFPAFSNKFTPFEQRARIPAPPGAGANFVLPRSTGSKRIPDADHPYKKPAKGAQRSPCPGLNTMANHGYIPRSGIVHINDLISGAMEAFNMGFDLATLLAVFGVLVDGDPLSGMLSIGGSSPSVLLGGPGGLNNHGHFEGDASLTRLDYYFGGDNHDFNAARFGVFKEFINKYGEGSGNATYKVMQELRYQRFLDSKADNPQFQFAFPRYAFSYGESAFVLNFMANSRLGPPGTVDMKTLSTFFENETFPADWYRREQPYSLLETAGDTINILAPHFVPPGQNAGKNNYLPFEPSLDITKYTPHDLGCAIYDSIIAGLAPSLLQGLANDLLGAVDGLLGTLYKPFGNTFNCAPRNVSDPSLSRIPTTFANSTKTKKH